MQNAEGVRLFHQKRYSEAVSKFHEAANNDFIFAKFNLAQCLYSGFGINQDRTRADRIFSNIKVKFKDVDRLRGSELISLDTAIDLMQLDSVVLVFLNLSGEFENGCYYGIKLDDSSL